jgi:pimeloyl-ACP methyl ester carboxylesterase
VRPQSSHPWLNIVEYPFLTREFDTGEGWLSYVDHGQGRPVVFVHGSPTWSYLYRRIIKGLGGLYRCIAPDHLGFGLSQKPIGVDYSPQMQAKRFADLMDYLRLTDVTLVAQDCGGPIALSWALDHPDRVRQIVLFNTWMWSLRENRPARRLSNLVGNPINRLYYRWLKASPTFILPALFADRHRMAKASQIQFLEPFRNYRERRAIYAMVEGFRDGEAWFEELHSRREELMRMRALLLWGTKDPLFGVDALIRFQEMLPFSETVTFPQVGRMVPEEASHMALEEIRWFLLNQPALSSKLS